MVGSGAGGDTNNNDNAAGAGTAAGAGAGAGDGGDPPKPSLKTRFVTGMRSAGTFLYNRKDGTVLGRTVLSWAAILGFYVVFYAVLAAFWAACLAAFMHSIDFTQPTQQHKYSLLKDNPGMTFEPMIDSGSTSIWFNSSNPTSYATHVQRLQNITQPYINLTQSMETGNTTNVHKCGETGQLADINTVCLFDMTQIPLECRVENSFGFANGTPCIFLRPNKIYAYVPQPYDLSNPNLNATLDTPPSSLFNGPSRLTTDHIAVTCEGENPADVDNLLQVDFYPKEGFPFYSYPYLMQQNYLPPFVMAKFRVVPGRTLMIWCRIWALNMHHDLNDLQGSIHFELMVDPPVAV